MNALTLQNDRPILVGTLAAVATIGVTAALVLLTGGGFSPFSDPKLPALSEQPLLQALMGGNSGGGGSGNSNAYVYSDVAERAVKSVVSITTSRLMNRSHRRMRGDRSLRGGGHFDRRFFGNRGPHGFGMPQLQQGAGSGVIVRKDGIILTNNHVIANAETIRVELADQRTFSAEVVGRDPKTDLAVLRLKGPVGKLHVLALADSDKVRLGEVVLAIGNSFGRLHHTVTMGIVSAKGRANVGIVEYEDFIQTDAAINPGNSGGALVNMRGELVGINTAIASRSGGSQGVGFTIPANMARTVMASILDNGRVDRGWLGVVIQNMDAALMKAFGSAERGVLIGDVAPGSPAAKAGLKAGDVVLRFGGKRVQRTARLRNMVALSGSGVKVVIGIKRKGVSKKITVKLAKVPGQTVVRKAKRQRSDELIGMTLQPLDRQTRRAFSIGGDVKRGAVVTEIQPGSAASHAGLRRGDVLVEIGRRPFAGLDAAVKRIENAGDHLLLTIRRGKHNLYIMLRLP